ncbi:hypothetical protein V6N13_025463 [Hibiscus sabdariffa]
MPRRKLTSLRTIRDPPPEEEINFDEETVDESTEVPDTLDNIEIEGLNGRRRTRGHTTLPKLYNLPPGERVKVSRNSVGQPIGAEAGVLGHFLSVVARNPAILPINHSSWHDMPDANKNQALDQIKDKFSLEVSDNYLKQALGKKWRDHKTNEQEATSGSNVGRIQLFDITHTKKDGSPITPEAAEIMEKLREKRTEYETSASSAGSAVNMADIDNQVIAEVFGPERYGRVRGTEFTEDDWHC